MTPSFERFGLDHWMGLFIVVLVGWAIQRLGRRHPRGVEALLASWLVGYILEAYRVRWGSLTWATGLPLHLCDLLLLLALGLLARPSQAPRRFEILFFGAWGASIWAFLTPDLQVGFPHWRYFEFFFGHGLIFWILAHFYANRDCRIGQGAALRAWRWLWYYSLVVGGLDWLFDWNYGYLLHKPAAGSLLDYLGPWPVYILVGLAAEGLIFYGIERIVLFRSRS